MSENETGTEAVKSEEVVEETTQAESQEQDTTDYKALYEKAEADRKEEAARRKRAESKLERDRINTAVDDKVEKVLSKKDPSELDETDMLRLEMKGIEADDEVALIKEWKKDTGRDLKSILGNKRFQDELKELRLVKENKVATPTSQKRGAGAAADSEDFYFAKYEQTGSLPPGISHDMKMKLIRRKEAQTDPRRNPFE